MTGIELPAERAGRGGRPGSQGPRLRFRLPASRAGITWLVAVVVIGGLLAIQVGRQVYANYSIGQQASAMQNQITAMEQQNDQLRQELQYLQSDAYVGAEARRLANLGHSGDQLLIIPPGAEASLPVALQPAAPAPKPLLEQWLDLFFGH
jgi:cell division protein FtsB